MIEKTEFKITEHSINKKRYGQKLVLNGSIDAYFADVSQKLVLLFAKYKKLQFENKLVIPETFQNQNNFLGLENSQSAVFYKILELIWLFGISPDFWENFVDDRTKLLLIGIADGLVSLQYDKITTTSSEKNIAKRQGRWPVIDSSTGQQVDKILVGETETDKEYVRLQVYRKRQLLAAVRMVLLCEQSSYSAVVQWRSKKSKSAKVRNFESQFEPSSSSNEMVENTKVFWDKILDTRKDTGKYTPEELDLITETYAFVTTLIDHYGCFNFSAADIMILDLGEDEFEDAFNAKGLAKGDTVVVPNYDWNRQWLWVLRHENLHTVLDLSDGYLWGGLNEAIVERKTGSPASYAFQRFMLAVLEVLANKYLAVDREETYTFDDLLTQTALSRSHGVFDTEYEQQLNSILLQLFGASGILYLALAQNYNPTFPPVVSKFLSHPLDALDDMFNSYNRLHGGVTTCLSVEIMNLHTATRFYRLLREWAALPTLKDLLASLTPLLDVTEMDKSTFMSLVEQEEIFTNLFLSQIIWAQTQKTEAEAEEKIMTLEQIPDMSLIPHYCENWSTLLQLWYWREKKIFVPSQAFFSMEISFDEIYFSMIKLIEETDEHVIAAHADGRSTVHLLDDINSLIQGFTVDKNIDIFALERLCIVDASLRHLNTLPGESAVRLYQSLVAQLYEIVVFGFDYKTVDGVIERKTYERILLIEPGLEADEKESQKTIASEAKYMLHEHDLLFSEFRGDWQLVLEEMRTRILPERAKHLYKIINA